MWYGLRESGFKEARVSEFPRCGQGFMVEWIEYRMLFGQVYAYGYYQHSAFHVMQQQFNIKALQCIETLHKVWNVLQVAACITQTDICRYR